MSISELKRLIAELREAEPVAEGEARDKIGHAIRALEAALEGQEAILRQSIEISSGLNH